MSTFPNVLDTNSNLFVAARKVQTRLSTQLSSGASSMSVIDATGIVQNVLLTIDNEEVKVTSTPIGGVFSILRAQNGTLAADHINNSYVSAFVDSAYYENLKSAVIAIENTLGTNLTNVANVFVSTKLYNFTPQTPGGTLSIGSNTIHFSPVPSGVRFVAGTKHYLYVSGGLDAAEACLITGDDIPSGNIIITCTSIHRGSFSVSSASSGIYEAVSAYSGVGMFVMPKGTLPIYATILLPTKVSLLGQGSSATILAPTSVANPCIVIADALLTYQQGLGIHRDYQILGTGGVGLCIGGDPSGIFAPVGQTGSYLRFYNLMVNGTGNFVPLQIQYGNFVIFNNCGFNADVGPAIRIPSTAGGNFQPLEFYGCVATATAPNAAIQMDNNGFLAASIMWIGGQVSGYLTGLGVYWESHGTHYEPSGLNTGIININNANSHRVSINGGLISIHGTALTNAISIAGAGNYVYLSISNVLVFDDSGMVTTNFVSYGPAASGALNISGVDFAPAGDFTNLYVLNSPGTALININRSSTILIATAASTLVFPKYLNYPTTQLIAIIGATVGGGITDLSGLIAGQSGIFYTYSVQTFTAGAHIGNTITTVIPMPYTFYFDGTKIWIK
jgi:hypothetical protein